MKYVCVGGITFVKPQLLQQSGRSSNSGSNSSAGGWATTSSTRSPGAIRQDT
jgi:hypothetical protein